MPTWQDELKAMRACKPAVDWARHYPTVREAWAACPRADWMVWYLVRCGDLDIRMRAVEEVQAFAWRVGCRLPHRRAAYQSLARVVLADPDEAGVIPDRTLDEGTDAEGAFAGALGDFREAMRLLTHVHSPSVMTLVAIDLGAAMTKLVVAQAHQACGAAPHGGRTREAWLRWEADWNARYAQIHQEEAARLRAVWPVPPPMPGQEREDDGYA